MQYFRCRLLLCDSRIRFGFSPKLVLIFGDYLEGSRYTGGFGIFWGPSGFIVSGGSMFGFNYFVGRGEGGFTWLSNGISFYASDANYQLNMASKRYDFVAIG